MTDSHPRSRRRRPAAPTPVSSAAPSPSPASPRPRTGPAAGARPGGPRPTIRISLPDGWARSGLAGIEAALISWGLMMLLTLVGYLGVSDNAWLGQATWSQAMGVGGDVWAAVLGCPVEVGGVAYRAVPTLMTLLSVIMLRVLLLPGRRFPAAAQWTAVPTFAITSLGLVASTADHAAWLRAVPGAVAVAGTACLWAVASQTQWRPSWAVRAPWAHEGLLQARGAVIAAAAAGLAGLAASLWASREAVAGIQDLLLASGVDTAVLVLAQLLFTPTAMAWALSWLAGPGFHVGTDALHAPGTAPVLPIPAIPLLGAVPSTAPGNQVALILVLLGAAVGAWVRWRHRAEDLGAQALAGLTCLVVSGAVVAGWFWLAVLHLGAERMALLGPRVLAGAAMATLEVVVTAQIVALAAHPASVALARRGLKALRARVGAASGRLGARVRAGAGASRPVLASAESAPMDEDGPARAARPTLGEATPRGGHPAPADAAPSDGEPTERLDVSGRRAGDAPGTGDGTDDDHSQEIP